MISVPIIVVYAWAWASLEQTSSRLSLSLVLSPFGRNPDGERKIFVKKKIKSQGDIALPNRRDLKDSKDK